MNQPIRNILTTFYFSFPVQLLIRQIRRHKILMAFWLVLLGFVSGTIGEGFGGPHLFLDPEYMGHENFWSVFMVGSALGAFLFAYMITFYIHESYNFHFIANCKNPFYTLSFNNLLIPGSFLIIYIWKFIHYHSVGEGFTWGVAEKVIGLLSGIGIVFLISATYFFTRRSLLLRFGQKLEKKLSPNKGRGKRWVLIGKARRSVRREQLTDNYFVFPFRIVRVNPINTPDVHGVVDFLNQHHGKLLLMQIFIFLLVAVLGLLEGNRFFQIPAGASFLLMLSLMMMIMGAITFWFRKSGILTIAVLAGMLFLYDRVDSFSEKNHAFGMNYEVGPAEYSRNNLEAITTDQIYNQDRQSTIALLESWKQNYQEKYGKHKKPRAVFLTASGGGLRSAYWTFRSLQMLDSLTQGQIYDEVRLMSGASGGMFGLSYYRELALRRTLGEEVDINSPQYHVNISKDMLNRIFFKMYADVFLPNREIQIGDKVYDRETGYSFDHQLGMNLPELKDRKLGDYAAYEMQGITPQVILTPTILNQGRKLYISSSPVSYLTRPNKITDHYLSKAVGVEFRRLFADQGADELFMSTALRMNATFPFVLPVVELPSQPPMEVMDAGAIDNYGTQTAVKYLFEFKDWFEENTSGVIFIQIRDNLREDPIQDGSNKGFFARAMTPLGGGYYSMAEAKDMSNDYMLEFVREWYEGYVEVVPIQYSRENSQDPASLSWHLTRKEKANIHQGLFTEENQYAFMMVSSLYKPDLLAENK